MTKQEFYFSDEDCIEFGNIQGSKVFVKRLIPGHYLFNCLCGCERNYVFVETKTMGNKFVCLEILDTYDDFLEKNN